MCEQEIEDLVRQNYGISLGQKHTFHKVANMNYVLKQLKKNGVKTTVEEDDIYGIKFSIIID